MRFVVDECTGPSVARWLSGKGHDVISIYDEYRGVKDGKIVELANEEKRVLITNDKDFGELIFRLRMNHSGIVLLRLDDERPKNKIAVLEKLLISHSNRLAGNFLVVTETSIRIIELR